MRLHEGSGPPFVSHTILSLNDAALVPDLLLPLKEKDNKEFGKTIVKEPVNSIHTISN